MGHLTSRSIIDQVTFSRASYLPTTVMFRPFLPRSAAATRFAISVPPWRAYHPSVLPNLVSTSSQEFQAKSHAMNAVLDDLNQRIMSAQSGGGEKAIAKLRKAGKKTPRER